MPESRPSTILNALLVPVLAGGMLVWLVVDPLARWLLSGLQLRGVAYAAVVWSALALVFVGLGSSSRRVSGFGEPSVFWPSWEARSARPVLSRCGSPRLPGRANPVGYLVLLASCHRRTGHAHVGRRCLARVPRGAVPSHLGGVFVSGYRSVGCALRRHRPTSASSRTPDATIVPKRVRVCSCATRSMECFHLNGAVVEQQRDATAHLRGFGVNGCSRDVCAP